MLPLLNMLGPELIVLLAGLLLIGFPVYLAIMFAKRANRRDERIRQLEQEVQQLRKEQ